MTFVSLALVMLVPLGFCALCIGLSNNSAIIVVLAVVLMAPPIALYATVRLSCADGDCAFSSSSP